MSELLGKTNSHVPVIEGKAADQQLPLQKNGALNQVHLHSQWKQLKY